MVYVDAFRSDAKQGEASRGEVLSFGRPPGVADEFAHSPASHLCPAHRALSRAGYTETALSVRDSLIRMAYPFP